MFPVTMSVHVLFSCFPAAEVTVARLAIPAVMIPIVHVVIAVIATEEGFITGVALVPTSINDRRIYRSNKMIYGACLGAQ